MLPILGVEVGGPSKSVTQAFKKYDAGRKLPGMRFFVARELKRGGRCFWRYYSSPDDRHDSIEELLEAFRA